MTKYVTIAGFLIAFAAGLVVGFEVRRQTAQANAPAATRPSRHGFLTAELNLSPEQQEQMKAIWSEAAHRGGREQDERRRQYRKERDDAIAALIRPDDKPRFEAAGKLYTERMAGMEKEWRASFAAAVEKTKQILTPEQRQKYEDLLKKQEAERVARDAEREKSREAEKNKEPERKL